MAIGNLAGMGARALFPFSIKGKPAEPVVKPPVITAPPAPKTNKMVDKITLQRIEDIHPKLRPELRQIYKEICEAFTGNVGVRFVQVFRTFAEQDALYAQGRNGDRRQKVTDAKGGQSYHNYGLGVDFVLIQDSNNDGKISSEEIIWDRNTDLDKDRLVDWIEVVKVFQKYGWLWGASWKDYPHFEKSFGFKTSQLLAKYKSNDFIPGTKYVNI